MIGGSIYFTVIGNGPLELPRVEPHGNLEGFLERFQYQFSLIFGNLGNLGNLKPHPAIYMYVHDIYILFIFLCVEWEKGSRGSRGSRFSLIFFMGTSLFVPLEVPEVPGLLRYHAFSRNQEKPQSLPVITDPDLKT